MQNATTMNSGEPKAADTDTAEIQIQIRAKKRAPAACVIEV